MEKQEVKSILEAQKRFIAEGKMLSINYRIELLKQLKSLILRYEPEIIRSLWEDFHKPEFEVIVSETRLVIMELNHTLRNLKSWSRKKRVRTPLVHFLSWSYLKPQPYGQVLILSPWNYPFQLAFVPLIGAIAAGNSVVLKMSQRVPCTMAVMEKLLENLPREIVAMVNGDHSLSDFLLEQKFDYIFFTGSPEIGKHVAKIAAENLTPFSLELGGKNPCLVASDARLDFAAKRIAWGKFLNAGQSCVAPDYVLVDRRIKSQFLFNLKNEIEKFCGENPETCDHFCRVISRDNVRKLALMMMSGTVITGGKTNEDGRYVAPTVISDLRISDPAMQEEIFGPLLPVVEFDDLMEAYTIMRQTGKSLSSYIFSQNSRLIREFINRTESGSVAVNDNVIQFVSPYLPFGGVGKSGTGRYHGRKSFETFSNMRSVIVKSNLFDLPLRYPPYSRVMTRFVKWIMSL